jgi:hypothetical protein
LSALLLASCGGSSEAPPATTPAAAPAKAPEPVKAPPDPMKDASAWKALPAADRATKAADVVAKTDAGDGGAVERTRAFLAERGEDAAVASLAKAAVAKGSSAAWAHQAAGDVEIGPEVDACIRSCEAADEASDPKFLELKALRAKHAGAWWADAATAKSARDLCAAAKAADAALATPYGQGVAKWVRWQRAIAVMQDAPALTGSRGPYLIFVSLDSTAAGEEGPAKPDDAPKGATRKKVREMKDVPPADIEKASKILQKNLDLMEQFYDGWITQLGPVFGFTRYGPENTDESTMLKMNIFMNASEYHRFNIKNDNAMMDKFARAFYTPSEPRFITTYDGGDDEDPFQTEQVQCHEATHQLVHLYTWDLSRKALNREVKWDDCRVRPMWSEEGFAEFFSSFAMKDGKRTFMKPLLHRILEIYVLNDIVEAKKWRPFDLKEFLSVSHAGQLVAAGEQRAGLNAAERPVAENVMSNLFYAEAWSLYSFLWNAEEGGKPKYRDRFIEYLKFEFHVRYEFDKHERKEKPLSVSTNDFRRIMGVKEEPALVALDKEWRAWETKLIAVYKNPGWDEARKGARKAMGVDK